jgi:hypothetical protein
MFDEEWKDVKYGGVEGHWGLFNGECVDLPCLRRSLTDSLC